MIHGPVYGYNAHRRHFLKDFSVKDKIASGVLVIGVPAALGSLLMSVSSIIMNAQMTRYGDMAVGVAMKQACSGHSLWQMYFRCCWRSSCEPESPEK